MNDEISWATVALAIAAPAAGILGVMVGQWGSRGREIRAMRRQAYIKFLAAAGNLPSSWGSGEIRLEAAFKVNELLDEMHVVASRRVLHAIHSMFDVLSDDTYLQMMREASSLTEKYLKHNIHVATERRSVVRLMRRDVLPWWRWRSRSIADLPEDD